MKKSNSNTSTEKQNTETNIRADLTSKSLNEISCLAKQSDEDTKTDKKTNKFDKTTQSFSPQINHNKQKLPPKYRELVIDTRNTPLNEYNHKFDFVKFRHEKYQTHKYPTKIIKEQIKLDRPMIVYQDAKTGNVNIYEDKMSLQKKVRIMKNQLINNPINGLIPAYSLSYNNLPHYPISNTLPTILTLRKNQFEEYNKRTDNMKEGIEKIKQMQFLMNNNSMPISSYYGNKSNFKKHVDMENQPFSYIYLLNDKYSISEKMRFQKNMDKLIKVKKCIDYDLKNFDIDKLNNFLNFIKTDFLIDPSINLRQNILNIMNKKKINLPQMSNALDCVNEEYLLKEMEKRQNLIRYKKIGDIFSFFEESYKYNRELLIQQQNKDKPANIKTVNYISQEKLNKNKKSKSKKRLRQHPLEYKGLCVDLHLQQKISSPNNKIELDIVQNPKNVVEMVKKEIIKQKNGKEYNKNKTCYNWSKNVFKNKRLYDNKKKEDSVYNEIRKKNMLTEYIVFMKAKNHIKLSQLKKQFNI